MPLAYWALFEFIYLYLGLDLIFANSHCNSVLTVLKAYVVWQFLTFVMTLRPVSLYSYCSLLLSLHYLGVFDFLLKRPCIYLISIDDLSKLSYAWDLTNAYRTIQLVYNFFLGSLWSRQCSASEFFLNSFICSTVSSRCSGYIYLLCSIYTVATLATTF